MPFDIPSGCSLGQGGEGCCAGREAIQTAACWWALSTARGMGSRSEWMFRRSVGVDVSAPVIITDT